MFSRDRHLPLFDPTPEKPAVEKIRVELGDCQRCKLAPHRRNIVFGSGDPHARLMFVGEAPGENEDATGLPFVGRAGNLLVDLLSEFSLLRDDVYIANVIKCRPPGNRNPEPDEISSCQPFLEMQISAVHPQVLVGLGKFAAQWLLGKNNLPITKLRTLNMPRPATYYDAHWMDEIPVIATFHPAFALRDPSAVKHIREDLRQAIGMLR